MQIESKKSPQSRKPFLVACLLSLGLLFVLPGCSSDLSTVKGKVTLDGTPIERAFVEFSPKATGSPAYGRTDSSGNYSLMFSLERAGAAPGEYTVRITTYEVADVGKPAVPERVPDRYNRKSELTAEVKANQTNVVNFDLKTDGAKVSQPKKGSD